MTSISRFFRTPGMSGSKAAQVFGLAKSLGVDIQGVISEYCYYVQTNGPFIKREREMMQYLLAETFDPTQFGRSSFIDRSASAVIEVGPRLNFETTWSSAAVEICHRSGLETVSRLERSLRIGLFGTLIDDDKKSIITAAVHDRMTEMLYPEPLTSFETGLQPAPTRTIPLAEAGISALEIFSKELGCGWDHDDFTMIEALFKKIGRDPTDVELFQIAQANSDHSRHWFFRGHLVIDGEPVPEKNLMEIIKAPLVAAPGNSIIAFCDDSSAIQGFEVNRLVASDPTNTSELVTRPVLLHPTLTAETHNFPTGVAPFPGAATGTGGRIRDNQAVGRGGLFAAGSAGYMTGNLNVPGFKRPWEEDGWKHPDDLSSPLDILISASNGASAYGNCFGEPVIYGCNREVGLVLPDGSYTAYFKPIMYTSGAGAIDDLHTQKGKPEAGMLVIQVGGPAYRIGMGGSAASSMEQGANSAELDFNAVQRGNPEMGQRVDRFVRACIELGDNNPIVSAHDLGAGGDSNALPEIVEPAGATINLRALPVGDRTLSVLEIWGNESQERNAFLVLPKSLELIKSIAARENVPLTIAGQITGDGYLILHDETDGSDPVRLPLDEVLGQLPAKTFNFTSPDQQLEPLVLPENIDFRETLERVLNLVGVGSKAFLTRKVDRSVTGRIAQQQCVGPLHVPISDYALIASSYHDNVGVALTLGEQPVIGLINPAASARMAMSEALLNMIGVRITSLSDIKAEANWMLPAKQPGEGAKLYQAACALRDMAIQLGIAFDGGKDSSSMASQGVAPDGTSQSVKAPMTLVVAPYATVPDITKKATPDLKKAGNTLLYLPLSDKRRLGGSALAQVYGQIGNECPDIEDVGDLIRVFVAVQALLDADQIESIHDVSDGGLIVTLLEMAIGGNTGFLVDIVGDDLLATCFAQEAGIVIETSNPERVLNTLSIYQVPEVQFIGEVGAYEIIVLNFNGERILTEELPSLRASWEKTSFQIDHLQANSACVDQEESLLASSVPNPPYRMTFEPLVQPSVFIDLAPRVAILREQGSNGDREMAAAFKHVGFEVWDVTMTDLIKGSISLKGFQVIAFVGGFSFGDVLDSGKGWSSVIRHNERLAAEFADFFARPDTLSLGVCNGCQVMALLGIPGLDLLDELKPRFITNQSERFESRFPIVEVMPSPAIMLQDMAGSRLGVWISHGEGRFRADSSVLTDLRLKGLLPLRFVDNNGEVTETYPFNPNGSPEGITALCSSDGRHLAMMPHPERTFLPWQWPWKPESWKELEASPWAQLFQNAYNNCK